MIEVPLQDGTIDNAVPTPILISAIVAAIGGAGALIARAIRWGSKQMTLAYQRSIDALVENTRSNARVETLVQSIRDDFRNQIRRIERDRSERDRGDQDRPDRTERATRNQTRPRMIPIQTAEEEREDKETRKRRAGTERGAGKSRTRGDEES